MAQVWYPEYVISPIIDVETYIAMVEQKQKPKLKIYSEPFSFANTDIVRSMQCVAIATLTLACAVFLPFLSRSLRQATDDLPRQFL